MHIKHHKIRSLKIKV